MNCNTVLFSILKAAVCSEPIAPLLSGCTEEDLRSIFSLAKKYSLGHLVADCFEKASVIPASDVAQYSFVKNHAICGYIRRDHELERLSSTLEAAKISFIPLKGSVMRNYYPEPWMRNSCDIDVLVQEENLERAADLLSQKLGYVNKGKGDHDISLFSKAGIHIELHYLAIDSGRFLDAQTVLRNVWKTAVPKAGSVCHLLMSDEMFYFYHVVHMAKHIENGGCGIRPFLDLWILNHQITFDRDCRQAMLKAGRIHRFSVAAEKLADAWFSGSPKDPMTQQLEDYVLSGGLYGDLEKQIMVSQSKLGGKSKYALRKIFLPYEQLKFHYPILVGRKYLTPVFEVVRWCKLLFRGGFMRSVKTLRMNHSISQDQVNKTFALLEYLGLS